MQDLCNFLNALGARIDNIGSNTLHIHGVEGLSGGDFTIGADYLEVVSYIGAALVTGGSVRVRAAGPEHLNMARLVFRRLGAEWEVDGQDIVVPADQKLQVEPDLGGAIPSISVMPWPAFPTDLMSVAIVVASQSQGTVLFHDWMFEGRMFFIDKLVSMGARIILCDPHRCIVEGPRQLVGETLESPDIRAGLALVLAALAGRGLLDHPQHLLRSTAATSASRRSCAPWARPSSASTSRTFGKHSLPPPATPSARFR